MRRRTSVAARAATSLGTTALLIGALASCTGGEPEAPTSAKPTPLASYDGTVAHVQRVSFCSRIPDEAVAAAVGTDATTAHYGNGEPLPGTEDLSHEYGCVFTGSDGTIARSWVFVPPVTPQRARQLATAARRMPRCSETPAAKFGDPAVGTLCRSGGATTVTYRGLFGDAWLSCSVSEPGQAGGEPDRKADAALVAKAGTWCVQVAATASS